MLTPFQKEIQEKIFSHFGIRFGVDKLKEIADVAAMKYLKLDIHLKKEVTIHDAQMATAEEFITGTEFDETIKEIFLHKQSLPF